MFDVESYLTGAGEQKLDILIHREDDGCFAVVLKDLNGNLVNDIGEAEIEMTIYDRAYNYHPIIVIPMDKQTMEMHLSQKETRMFYFDHDYYYTLVFISEHGDRYTFATGDIRLISKAGDSYECCKDRIELDCGYHGIPRYW